MNKYRLTYRHTTLASYLGFVTQAIVNNLAPLLFIIFREYFNLNYEQLGRIVFLNFAVQLITDVIVARYADRIGYRIAIVGAHVFSSLGLVLLGVLPRLLSRPYLGISIAVTLYAIGGGTIEVLVSPIVEAIPGERKASSMSLLHSFYCWGQMAVVLFSTLILFVFGNEYWYVLPPLWALVPFFNCFLYARVPIAPLVKDESKLMTLKELMKNKHFLIALVLMACAGSSELTMSQWSSIFAQQGLQVSKVVGDILGPCLFAGFMGTVRMLYGLKGDKIKLKNALIASSALCVICYSIAVFSRNPIFSLFGCAFTGVSVALMWPGTISLTSARLPYGGTIMFGMFAVMGDLGASVGPWIAGFVSEQVKSVSEPLKVLLGQDVMLEQARLKSGILSAIVFPILMFLFLILFNGDKKKKSI
jgi:fucose permease